MNDTAREPQDEDDPVMAEVAAETTESVVAFAGHPIHAMLVHFPIALTMTVLGADLLYWWNGDPFWARAAIWMVGLGFLSGALAGLAGLVEILAVPGIRTRVGSWSHGVAGLMLISLLGLNWGFRFQGGDVMPVGILLSLLSAIVAGAAGWHGGKLIFHHGIGLIQGEETEARETAPTGRRDAETADREA
ncbi:MULTISPECIES: DUF2231 domain-containing protein [unclassified Haematobacter]|uniref:DUF2231 domain-containing protein n=1 Tax=unclassified Haematobacter TaxID=2640585 RepID=UPI0025C22868|nr:MULTISPECIES: DUF2231 domain-containing protein [unclassified Haematobacter]